MQHFMKAKRRGVARVLGVAVCLAFVAGMALSSGAIELDNRPGATVRISTGPPTVSFRPLAEAMVRAYAHVTPDIHFVLIDTPGSVRNIQNLEQGTADVG